MRKNIAVWRVARIQTTRGNRKLLQEAEILQKYAYRMNMNPRWYYTKQIRTSDKHKQCSLNKQDGAKTNERKENAEMGRMNNTTLPIWRTRSGA